MAASKIYMCIDLKSFYASVECLERGLDPFTTNLVVADPARTEKTICLAITPAMKSLGISNRCRVFEIPAGIDYIMAPPQMRLYMRKSAEIYSIYLRYISHEDIHVYSIDEVFIDATPYLKLYSKTPKELAHMLMDAVFEQTGICATAGIGTNMFLAKVALDITAKHVDDHIGYLDEQSFKEQLWDHRPITDFWNIGPGIARRLANHNVFDLRGVCELQEKTLYKEFGVNAELLIDHAHGIEPCTIAEIKNYVPQAESLSNSQVLSSDYSVAEARIIVQEMVESQVLELVDRGLVAETISVSIGYKRPPGVSGNYSWARGGGCEYSNATRKLPWRTNSRKKLMASFLALYDEIVKDQAIRRLAIGLGNILPEEMATFDLFSDIEAERAEHDLQKAVLAVKDKFGKNALMMGVSLTEKATARERNEQVGGHRG